MQRGGRQAYRVEVGGGEAGEAHPLHGREESPDIALPRRRRRRRGARALKQQQQPATITTPEREKERERRAMGGRGC